MLCHMVKIGLLREQVILNAHPSIIHNVKLSASQKEFQKIKVVKCLYMEEMDKYEKGIHTEKIHSLLGGKKYFFIWRKGGDSNPRYDCSYTRFPSVRVRPLRHLSG